MKMKTKDSIRFYYATKYRSHSPGIDSIKWHSSFATYDEARARGNENRISEEGLSIFLVYKDTYIFECWPHSVETGHNPCFVGSTIYPNKFTSIATKIDFGPFFWNPEKYLQYAQAIKPTQEHTAYE